MLCKYKPPLFPQFVFFQSLFFTVQNTYENTHPLTTAGHDCKENEGLNYTQFLLFYLTCLFCCTI